MISMRIKKKHCSIPTIPSGTSLWLPTDTGHRPCAWLLLSAVAMLACGAVPAPAAPAPFTVTVRNLATDDGRGRFALYATPADYDAKRPLHAGEAVITNRICVWRIPALPAGNYAVTFFHDANDNGVLDRNAIGIPREPVAFSNNTRPRLGPPRFARMRVVHGTTPRQETLDAFSALGRRGRLGVGLAAIVNQSPYDTRRARLIAIPMISYIGRRIIVTGPRVSWLFTSTPHTRTALTLQYSFDGFDKDESDRLEGMHARNDTVMGGISSAWLPTEQVTLSGELAADILDEHGGWRGEIRIGRNLRIRDLALEPGLSIECTSAKAANHYYGVRAAEATLTRPAYRLGDAWNVGLLIGTRYTLSERTALFGNLTYTLLDPDIQDSPIVVHDALFSIFLAVAYAL
jgi:MipA family protein